ncbi:hypothetical protein P153DRAFT_362803 [Dothidotthia symphoricarpi CBS 119687]|uniref:Uncharacterized protein n=1 Tax=Dothidotthia symphoricarpi CBS 119687 TaxID=1392245 RepID=A0A6A6AS12_9PLEO|nr:uncharacterized protein P153DRAFT_362803 [Dothidotthia symphoricarpi CBS 119687]KAF2133724.1 hypothetical protein P153DRAFT_362803 [Dothidotthia symphoricarpi CBS 119687]
MLRREAPALNSLPPRRSKPLFTNKWLWEIGLLWLSLTALVAVCGIWTVAPMFYDLEV